MSYNDNKSTPADVAATIAVLLLAAAITVLLCIYILKLGGAFDKESEIPEAPHVISEITTAETTTEEIIITTTPAIVEESETAPAVTIPLGEYDELFFENALVIGDSLSTGFVNYEFLPAEKVFAQAGLTPSSIMFTEVGGTLVYDKAASLNPQYICIMLGTNGISYLEADFMSEKMSLFIDELKAECPDSKLVLVSIPPVTAEHEIDVPETSIERIKLYNSCIEKLAEEKGVIWVETYSILCDGTGYLADEYAETDGLHLKIHAYPVILSRIQEAIMNAELAEETETETETETEVISDTEATSDTEAAEEAVVTTSPEADEAVEETSPNL